MGNFILFYFSIGFAIQLGIGLWAYCSTPRRTATPAQHAISLVIWPVRIVALVVSFICGILLGGIQAYEHAVKLLK